MPNLEEIKKRSVKGVVGYTVRSLILYVVAIGATALLSVYLTPSEFGVYFVVTAVMGMFTFLSDVGLAAALVQMKEEPSLVELRTSFTVQQVLALVIMGVMVGLTPVWQSYSGLDQDGLNLLYALAFSFILASFKTIPSILLERELKFNLLVLPQVVEQIGFYAVAVGLASQGWGIKSYTLAVLVRSVLGLMVIYLIKPWSIGLAWSKDAIRKLLRFGIKFQLNDLLARLKDDLYVVVLAKFIQSTEMGYLGWAKRWSMFPYQFSVQNVISITFPTFARIQQDKKAVKKALNLSVYFISLIIFPILTGIIMLSFPLTEVFEAYGKWQPALPALAFFCLNIGLAAMANPFISALNALGKINQTLKLMTIMTLTTWILTPFFMLWWGYLGVAILSSIVAGMSLYAYYLFGEIVKCELWSNIKMALLSSLLMGLGLWWLRPWAGENLINLSLSVIAGGLIYLITIIVLDYRELYRKIRMFI